MTVWASSGAKRYWLIAPNAGGILLWGTLYLTWNGPLHECGFVDDQEITELIELDAIGEVAGWAYDHQGVLLKVGTNQRLAGVSLEQPVTRLMIGVAGGVHKTEAILAALTGKLISGLITDEARSLSYSHKRITEATLPRDSPYQSLK